MRRVVLGGQLADGRLQRLGVRAVLGAGSDHLEADPAQQRPQVGVVRGSQGLIPEAGPLEHAEDVLEEGRQRDLAFEVGDRPVASAGWASICLR